MIMKKLLLLLLSVVLLLSPTSSNNTQNTPGPHILALSESITQFSYRMYVDLTKSQSGNIVFSPLSIHSALTLLSLGSTPGSTTQMELLTLLSQFLNTDELVKAYRDVLQSFSNGSLLYGNQIWLDDSTIPRVEFVEKVADLSTGVDTLDFSSNKAVNRINDWVNELTRGNIKKLVNSVDADTQAIIANALYLKEQWTESFRDERGSTAFRVDRATTRNLTFMERKGSDFYYGKFKFGADDYPHEIVRIPYANPGLEMQLILPNERLGSDGYKAIEDFLELQLKQDIPQSLFSSVKDEDMEAELHLRMPKFKAKVEIDATDVLQRLGLKSVFTEESELGNLSESANLRVNKVIHKSIISVDLNGTEAAAATFIQIVPFAANFLTPREVTVDRPFIFRLQDTVNNVPILLGRIVDPGTRSTN